MINRIGTIVKTVVTDDPEVFETETLEGYHVNSTEEIEGAEDYLIPTPTELVDGEKVPRPYNLFFGISAEDTFFYKFTDKKECDAVIGEEPEIEDIS